MQLIFCEVLFDFDFFQKNSNAKRDRKVVQYVRSDY